MAALKDVFSGNLDRIQIVKGWLDENGEAREKVYDVVVWSGDRKPGTNGKLPPVGNTVDVANATWSNTIGAPDLITVWKDPDFDPPRRRRPARNPEARSGGPRMADHRHPAPPRGSARSIEGRRSSRPLKLRVALLLVLFPLASAVDALPGQEPALAIKSVTIVDPAAASVADARIADQTVVIVDGRIERVGSASSTAIPEGARVIDGRGQFLLPGFWDMHVHFNRDSLTQLRVMGPLRIANGVTSARVAVPLRAHVILLPCFRHTSFAEAQMPS